MGSALTLGLAQQRRTLSRQSPARDGVRVHRLREWQQRSRLKHSRTPFERVAISLKLCHAPHSPQRCADQLNPTPDESRPAHVSRYQTPFSVSEGRTVGNRKQTIVPTGYTIVARMTTFSDSGRLFSIARCTFAFLSSRMSSIRRYCAGLNAAFSRRWPTSAESCRTIFAPTFINMLRRSAIGFRNRTSFARVSYPMVERGVSRRKHGLTRGEHPGSQANLLATGETLRPIRRSLLTPASIPLLSLSEPAATPGVPDARSREHAPARTVLGRPRDFPGPTCPSPRSAATMLGSTRGIFGPSPPLP